MSSNPFAAKPDRPAQLRLVRPVDESEAFTVLGVRVSARSFADTLALLLEAPKRANRLRVHFAAVHTFVEAAKDEDLHASLNEADLVAPDGMPVVWLGRLKGRRVERVCGPDLMPALLDSSRAHGSRHYFYGGSPEVLEALVEEMSERFPGLQVAGFCSPPYRPLTWQEVDETAAMINAAEPDYVWVGLGSPKQDHWLAAFRPLLHAPVLLAVGAAFDYHAGHVKRAPRWAQRLGLEWLFRLGSEPRRLVGRYTLQSLRFLQLLIADAVRWREVTP